MKKIVLSLALVSASFAFAQKKAGLIDASKHFIIQSAHPSPFSVHKGFFGSRPFSKINQFLKEKGKEPINW